MPSSSKKTGKKPNKHRTLIVSENEGVEDDLGCEKTRGCPGGKRLVAKRGDGVNRHSISMFDSKYNAILALSARRDWSTAVYIDRLIDGDQEILNEFNEFLSLSNS